MTRSLVPIALAATIAFNALAQWLPLNGRTTGEISNAFDVYITPAAYAFGIWSLIYLGLIAYAVHAWRVAGRSARTDAIAVPFVLSCAANVAWLALWHYGYVGGSLAAMLALLLTVGLAHARLMRAPPPAALERWSVDHTFSVYFGWVTVATLVNLSVVLDAYDARPFALGATDWALVMLAAAFAIALAVTRRYADRWYLGVFVWATVGIVFASGQTPRVALAASLLALSILALMAFAPRLRRNPSQSSSTREPLAAKSGD